MKIELRRSPPRFPQGSKGKGANRLASPRPAQATTKQGGQRSQDRTGECLVDTFVHHVEVSRGARPFTSRIRSKTTIVSFKE